jgi:uncharacterized membrane protein
MSPDPVDEPAEARRLAAKQPAGLGAGRYGQPLHPLLVTIPIGAWVISFAFDLAAHGANEEFVYARAAFWLIGVGIVGAVAASVPGILDLLTIERGTPAFRTGFTHLVLSDVALVAFVISFLVRRGNDSLQAASVPVLLLSVVALAALAVSAWLGIRLTYRYGIRVADEATQREGFTLGDGSAPSPPDSAAAPAIDEIDEDAEVTS